MQGKCLCGAVHFWSDEAPVFELLCHCRDCQRATGSAYAPVAFFTEKALKVSGEVKYYESLGSSGKRIGRGFCPTCGSNLFGRLEKLPGLLSIRAGALDDPNQFHPKLRIYVADAPAWAQIDSTLRSFQGDVPPKGAA
ncbi:MAG: GFA family protein [Betaproteobacteria bacterium]|jgi:hypothetical protein